MKYNEQKEEDPDMKKFIRYIPLLILTVILLTSAFPALADPLPEAEYTWSGKKLITQYRSDTLSYRIEREKYDRTYVYVTKIWMADPGRQIRKSTAAWREGLEFPKAMMSQIPGCVLAINGSGYISPIYPTLEEGYPGVSADYFYTSLGSLAITDGNILRQMDEVPFYGVSLDAEGLHLWNGTGNADVLAGNPTQTWGFWHKCALIIDGQDILDRTGWDFAIARAARTIIAKVDQNNYLLLSVDRDAGSSHGLTLLSAVDFLMENFQLEWAYNLDGGPSSALMYRKSPVKPIKTVFGGRSRDFDILGFTD